MENKQAAYLTTQQMFSDERGVMTVAESGKEIPFEVKRIFVISHSMQNVSRGNHANKNSRFYMVSLAGSCIVTVNTGKEKTDFLLDKPDKGLFVNKMVWKEMHQFSADCILAVFSDSLYDPNEYIDSFEEYISLVQNI